MKDVSISARQKQIRVGTHGEDYGSWMSNPVFYVFGGIALAALVLAVLSFTVFRITALGIVFAAAVVVLLALLCWMAWVRRRYAFAAKLRDMGFADVRYVETSEAIFGSKSRAAMMMLGNSVMLVGR